MEGNKPVTRDWRYDKDNILMFSTWHYIYVAKYRNDVFRVISTIPCSLPFTPPLPSNPIYATNFLRENVFSILFHY